jgi:hypothetical protein
MSEQDQEKTTPQGGTSSKSGTKSTGTATKSTAGSRSSSKGRTGGGKRTATGEREGLQGPAMGCARRDSVSDPFQSPNWRPQGDSFGTGRRVWPD